MSPQPMKKYNDNKQNKPNARHKIVGKGIKLNILEKTGGI